MASKIVDLSGGGSSQSETSSIDPDIARTIKGQLYRCLSGIHSPGSFASFGTSLDPINPGISIDGIGTIGLPLSERDARAIIGACHQAPFGKGSKTLVDTSIRRTWELNADQFQLRNPRWQQALGKIIKVVGNDLGVVPGAAGIKAKLYKMLLYEEGAMFKPHKDSEKIPRMFGTLVICLPSEHKGGELRITHGGQTRIYETAKASEFAQSHMAWYSDVTHEIMKVRSGYRLVLTYNLIYTAPGVPQSAASLGDEKSKLHNIFAVWKGCLAGNSIDCPKVLAYVLDHKYTEANLQFSHLKGNDRLGARYLKEVCEEAGFCFYLANLHRIVEGGCNEEYSEYEDHEDSEVHGHDNCDDDGKSEELEASSEVCQSDISRLQVHKIEDVYSDTLELKNVVGLEGTEVVKVVPFQLGDIVQPNPFQRGPDEEDYSGFTGNEGVSSTHFYHNTVALLIPQECHVSFLLEAAKNNNVEVRAWLSRLIDSARTNPSDGAQKELVELLECVIQLQTTRVQIKASGQSLDWADYSFSRPEEPFPGEVMGEVLKGALLLGRVEWCVRAIELVQGRLPSSVFPELGKAMHSHPSDMKKIASMAVDNQHNIHEKHAALNVVLGAYETKDLTARPLGKADTRTGRAKRNSLREWVKGKFGEMLREPCEPCFKEDGRALVGIAETCGKDVLFQSVLPIVKSHASTTAFVIAFLAHLFKVSEEGAFTESVVANIFRDVLSDMIDAFTLDFQPVPNKRQKTIYPNLWVGSSMRISFPLPDTPPIEPTSLAGEDVANLIGDCLSLGLTVEIDQLLAKIVTTAEMSNTSCFSAILLPLLARLFLVLHTRNIRISTPRYHQFAHRILTLYLARYVGLEPRPSTSWKRPTCGCRSDCQDCNSLDRFLADPEQKVGRFSVAKPRRAHLQQQLEIGGSTCTHETDRRGSPQTLVVTKTERGWKEEKKTWQGRCKEAVKMVEGLGVGESVLSGLLGSNYKELVRWGMKVEGLGVVVGL